MQLLSKFTLNTALIALFIYFVIKGYRKGFVSQIFDLLTLAVALLVAWFLYTPLGEMFAIVPKSFTPFQNSILAEFFEIKINSFIWFIIVFLTTYIFLKFLAKIFNLVSKAPIISGLNRFLGVVFGIVNFIVVALIIGMVLSMPIFSDGVEAVKESKLSNIIEYSDFIMPWLEENFEEFDAIDILKKKPQQATKEDIEKIKDYLEKNELPFDKINEFIKEFNNE